MNEHKPKSDTELDMKIRELDAAGTPEPYDAKRHARHLLHYFEEQEPATNDASLPLESQTEGY